VRGDQAQQEEIMRQLEKERISMPRASSVNWVQCSETLFTTFAGNPMNLYDGRTIDEIVAMKNKKGNQIPGFGPKILSLLALFYQELGMTIPPDAFPIDVHGQRFALSTGIVTVQSTVRNEQLEKILRPLFSTIAREEGWPMMEIAHAIWFLGNRRCTSCSQNSQASYDCPVYDLCGGAVPSKLYFQKALWDLRKPRYPRSGERPFGLPTDAPLFLAGDG
jgi:endonuclease III